MREVREPTDNVLTFNFNHIRSIRSQQMYRGCGGRPLNMKYI